MILRLAAATALALVSVPAISAPAEGPSRLLQGSDLFSLEVATDPQIRPDGAMIAYVRRSNDVMTDRARATIWLVDAKTGAQTPLVAGTGSHSQPRWSPDGKRIAYVSTAEGGAAQLFVRWMDTGATARVATLPDGPSAISWSPDGTRIAFIMSVPDEGMKLGTPPAKPEGAKWAPPLEVISSIVYRADGAGYLKPGYDHVFIVPADGGAPRQLTFGAFNHDGPLSWTPDGRTILLSADRSKNWQREPNNPEIYALDVATAKLTALTDRLGPDARPVVSPDGKRIAYLGYDDKYRGYENALLYVMDRDGGNARAITTALDRSIDDAEWAADGRSLYVQYDDHGSTRVARVTLDGKLTTVATGMTSSQIDRPYSGGSFSVARNGAVAFTSGDPQRPADVSIASGGKSRRLTRLNEELLGAKALGQVRQIPVKAADGRAIDAWLVTPPDFDPAKKYPMILEIHGGPFAAYGPAFASDNQLYAAAGYAVLYVNPRGSTSYGAEFANLIHHAYPGDDYGDLMAAVDAAIATGSIDADNLFVTGGSGGGVLTAWIVGKTDRFKAAATQKPVIDWASFVLTADMTPFFAKYWFGKFPWEDPQAYWNRSPLSLVGNVKTPTLVVVGSEDYRTPVSEAEQYYSALQLRGIPTALVKVPEASHGGIAARPSQSASKASAILAWFDKYRAKPQ
ncbi:alpha/beta hydrolase family protein [Edaphosphingomonas haloaromaticamans]|uniref:Prolyl tripeptidyl peptidase n=1 Tax=Edaphosphingomonas haloaromaticamans TaxID=653954 RepID=A0A1S1HJL0_9SPHN|nr:S9 family peptidase [Sphingomonas haloaromaticamans]OHT20710.1 Prolyl tripeptidyl peptidase precursor [Sphingomonas haloaromaticamans]